VPDYLGLTQQQDQANQVTTTDIFGQKSPLSLAGQPALPQGGPAAAGVSAAPPTKSGAGIAPQGPGPGGFGDLASGALPEASGGGSGSTGPGEGSPTGIGQATGVPSFSVPGTGGHVNVGLTGNVGINTGVPALDTVLNIAIGQGARAAGATTSIPQVLAMVTGNPVLGMVAGAMGMMGMPLTVVNLASMAASLNPNSIQNQLNALQSNPNVTEQDFAHLMEQIAQGFPTSGGPQAIGTPGRVAAGLDNPVNNPAASTQAAPTTPAANFSEAGQLSPTFAGLAAALGLGTGREDVGGPAPAAPPDDTGPGVGPGDTTGDF
jgi:hypothetical protein